MTPRLALIIAVSILAPALGGSTSPGAIAVLWCFMGTALLLAPPAQNPPRILLLTTLLALALPLAAFLPLQPESVSGLFSSLGLPPPTTRSPQPWLTVESLLIFCSALIWALYLSSQVWSPRARSIATQSLTVGLGLLALLALAAHRFTVHPPFWPTDVFGFFPNRNQSANVLSLASILAFGLGLRALPSTPNTSANPKNWLWLILLPLFLASLIALSSRAGIALLFLGLLALSLCHCFFCRNQKATALAASTALFLLAAFFVFGGKALHRLRATADFSTELRATIQRDALSFSFLHPVLGSGLGNFAPLFAPQRTLSSGQNMAIHPESDWLWAAGELGWPLTLVLLAAICWWLKQAFPFRPESDRRLRATLAIAAFAFLLHSTIDVPAHRLGSVLPALLLLSLSAHPFSTRSSNSTTPWRLGGAALLILGVLGALESLNATRDSKTPAPSSESLPWALPSQKIERLQNGIQVASAQDDFEQIANLADKALRLNPLHWQFHFLKATASVQFPQPDIKNAELGFAAARQLQPHWVNICLEEGRLWLLVGESQNALRAFQEALQRAKKSPLPYDGVFQSILGFTGPRPELRARLRTAVGSDPALLLLFLRGATPVEWEQETRALRMANPTFSSFSSEQRQLLFQLWYEHGNREELLTHIRQHPQLHADGWRCLALRSIDEGSFQTACELALRYAPQPSIPNIPISEPLPQLERRFAQQPSDALAGVTLILAQKNAGSYRDALKTLGRLRSLPNPPAYLPFLQFQIHAALGEWESAWRSWNG